MSQENLTSSTEAENGQEPNVRYRTSNPDPESSTFVPFPGSLADRLLPAVATPERPEKHADHKARMGDVAYRAYVGNPNRVGR